MEAKSDFQLLTFCPGREDFLEQVRKVRQAKLIIGEHGGALANMLLAQNGTGIIELVGSPEAQIGLPGEFPPYKRYVVWWSWCRLRFLPGGVVRAHLGGACSALRGSSRSCSEVAERLSKRSLGPSAEHEGPTLRYVEGVTNV